MKILSRVKGLPRHLLLLPAFDCILVQGYLKNGEVSDGGCQVEIQDETGKTLVSTFLTAQQIAEIKLES